MCNLACLKRPKRISNGRKKAPVFLLGGGMSMESADAGLSIAKLLASPGAIGVLAGAVCFMFLWPKSPKEGVSRIAVAGLSSHVFGDAVRETLVHLMPWLANVDIRAASYIIAAVPAWWILGAVVCYLSKGRDIKEMASDAAETVKKF